MVIMKACAACITWTAILLIELLSAALAYYMYDMSLTRQKEIDALPVAEQEDQTNYHTYIFYAFAGMFVILTCIIICYYNKIRIAIQIM